MAKKKGFKHIAVVSNGTNIHLPKIQRALLEYVDSIRISIYDWQQNNSDFFSDTLRRIESLRNIIEKESIKLEIAASILTRQEWNNRYLPVGLQVLNAGVNWIYFHPFCIDFDKEYPTQANQTGVLEAIAKFKEIAPNNANIELVAKVIPKKNKDILFRLDMNILGKELVAAI